jgi:hypothetical protein
MGTGAFSSRVKRPGREADNSLPPGAEVKVGGAIPTLPIVRMGVLSNLHSPIVRMGEELYVYNFNDISEEHTASIFRLEEYSEQATRVGVPEEGGNTLLWNVGDLLPPHMAPQLRVQ